VRVNLRFDRTIASKTVKALSMAEARAIWNQHGVELLWSDSKADAALHLDVIVTRRQTDDLVDGMPTVLGHTILNAAGVVQGPIRISFEAIEALLDSRYGANPAFRYQELGRGLGRVLAHEIGHVLLGLPSYHDRHGLMSAHFFADDLGGPDRKRFLLTADSVDRLRQRIAWLSLDGGESCPRTTKPD
jgi:hypothetical protein